MLTNPRDAFTGQSRSPNIYAIPYVRYSFVLCNSNFVFKTLHFFPVFDFINVVTLKSGSEVTEGH